jgi:hypothetical protein
MQSDASIIAAATLLTRWWRRCRAARPHVQKPYVYLHGIFEQEFLDELREHMWTVAASSESKNMYAIRHFFRDESLAARLFDQLPLRVRQDRRLLGCCSDLRFIRYPLGGFIAPHTDGVRVDECSGKLTRYSFLLYLASVPEGEGGETTFLDRLPEACEPGEQPETLDSIRPIEGSILLFPHSTPHQGEAVGRHTKVLLRGDLY